MPPDPSATSSQMQMASWMKKKGTKLGLWHRRYCKLQGQTLYISRGEHLPPTTTLELTNQVSVNIIEQKKKVFFEVVPPSGNKLIFEHENIDDALTWVSQLRNATMQYPKLSMSDFNIISVIGRGFYGKVMLCQFIGGNDLVAIKAIHKNRLVLSNKVSTIFTERNVLMRARHPFIVEIKFTFQTDSKVYLGLEYVSGGELFHYFQEARRLPREEVRLYIAELALALNYLHSLGIVYRDLKPENVLIDEQGHVKLTDFGLCCNIGDPPVMCGTSEYIAPEVIQMKPYGPQIDWWGIGIMTYELLYGRTPFSDENKTKVYYNIKSVEPTFPSDADPIDKSFINLMLAKNPEQRGGFEQLKKHPFFGGMDFDAVYRREITPHYLPQIDPDRSVQNFADEFTQEKPIDSVATPMSIVKDAFKGYNYVDTRCDQFHIQ